MFKIENITRENIRDLKPYSSARHEFSGDAKIFLDANENSLGSPLTKSYERYPDPYQKKVRQAVSDLKQIGIENIFLGNGSDECIDLLFRCFCEPGRDHTIICDPTYGMYEVYADINDVEVKSVPLLPSFGPDVKKLLKETNKRTKITWLCSPNNPTGNSVAESDLRKLLERSAGLVVVDEAYIDFSEKNSVVELLKEYQNLVVLQTFSKAWGLAGLRLGMALASAEIIAVLQKVKPPYNISQETQQLALQALKGKERKEQKVREIVRLREELASKLAVMPKVREVFPSDANFLLVRFEDADAVYQSLLTEGIVTRNRSKVKGLENCLRITVGTAVENNMLLDALDARKSRSVVHKRDTNETKIKVQLSLEGKGNASVCTGLDFFDHMLEQIAKHGKMDMVVQADGDLQVDEHHTVEDTAISLGEAFAQAIGDKRGMERYGFALPMDDAEAKVLIDFGGRSWLVWDVEFCRERVGDVPTELFYHFFKSFSDAAKCNLNIEAKGENEHHKIEAIFKAFAKALRMAVKKDPLDNYLPTTKGVL